MDYHEYHKRIGFRRPLKRDNDWLTTRSSHYRPVSRRRSSKSVISYPRHLTVNFFSITFGTRSSQVREHQITIWMLWQSDRGSWNLSNFYTNLADFFLNVEVFSRDCIVDRAETWSSFNINIWMHQLPVAVIEKWLLSVVRCQEMQQLISNWFVANLLKIWDLLIVRKMLLLELRL